VAAIHVALDLILIDWLNHQPPEDYQSHWQKFYVVFLSSLPRHVCAQDLGDVPCIDHERRTKIDIVFEKVVDHIDAEVKRCPACNATVKGLFPSDRHGPLQYGDGLKAFVINLLVGQVVALNRVFLPKYELYCRCRNCSHTR
jgi:hypothetical protein